MNAVTTTTSDIKVTFSESFEGGLTVHTLTYGPYNKECFVRVLNGQLDGCTCKNGARGSNCEHQAYIAEQLASTGDDDTVREEMALQAIAQAQAVLDEIRNRRAARAAFEQVRRQIREIENRSKQAAARAKVDARYAELAQQRAVAQAAGAGFSLLK